MIVGSIRNAVRPETGKKLAELDILANANVFMYAVILLFSL